MKSILINKNKFIILLLFFIFSFVFLFFFKISLKIIKRKNEPPSELIILPPSPTSRNNFTYCPYYTPKDKEFSQVPLKYIHGISIIIMLIKWLNLLKKH